METKITPEQQKHLNKIAAKFVAQGVFTGISHGVMLCLVNFILIMAAKIFEFNDTVGMFLALVGGFLVIRRMFSISKENHDRFKKEAKQILDQK